MNDTFHAVFAMDAASCRKTSFVTKNEENQENPFYKESKQPSRRVKF